MQALLLLSGGIDSPVAGHMVQCAGGSLDAVHFSLEPFTDDAPERKSRAAAELLDLPGLWVVPAGPLLGELTEATDPRLYFVLQKRFYLRVASVLARREGHEALVTGENLGQVSSQTLPNLATITPASEVPVLRPLLGLDKMEIQTMAQEIGSFEFSKGPEVCDVLGPDDPVTTSTLERVLEEEARVDLEDLVTRAVKGARRVPARA